MYFLFLLLAEENTVGKGQNSVKKIDTSGPGRENLEVTVVNREGNRYRAEQTEEQCS